MTRRKWNSLLLIWCKDKAASFLMIVIAPAHVHKLAPINHTISNIIYIEFNLCPTHTMTSIGKSWQLYSSAKASLSIFRPASLVYLPFYRLTIRCHPPSIASHGFHRALHSVVKAIANAIIIIVIYYFAIDTAATAFSLSRKHCCRR